MLSDNTTTMNSETENSLKVDVPKRTDSGRSRQPVLSPHKTDTFLFLASTRSEGVISSLYAGDSSSSRSVGGCFLWTLERGFRAGSCRAGS